MPRRRVAAAVLAWVAAVATVATGCSGDEAAEAPARRTEAVVVASFNFPESVLVAEMYAGALEAAGVPVRRELALGPRELVRPALQQGLVDVVPEYVGTALAAFGADPPADRADPSAAHRALAEALAPELRVLRPAPAQNQNGFAVTRLAAERLGLRTLTDLGPVAPRLTLAGPPECPRRPFCLEGLEEVYGLRFARFVPYETEQQRVTALAEDVADVAVLFTTDAHAATPDVVLLEDDRRLQPAENLVPVVATGVVRRFGARVTEALDAVSSRLTTENLRFLNWRVVLGGKDAAAEARGWLKRQGITAG